MKRVCAWCEKVLGVFDSRAVSANIISHGICDQCKDMLLGPQRVLFMAFLDGLNVPVVVVSSEGHIETANKYARELLQKELPDIVGFKGGDVFDCAYSVLPGGCGKSIHCDGCTIRNAVMGTFLTGESRLETEASLIHGTPDNNHEIKFEISTEKFRDVILLRISSINHA